MSSYLANSAKERDESLRKLEKTFYEPEFSEPIEDILEKTASIPRGDPITFGATPLDQLLTLRQQEHLLVDLLHYTYQIPEGVSLQLAAYIHETFSDRFRNRSTANNENYTSSMLGKSAYEDQPAILEVISRAETGHASPAELLFVQKVLGIRSVELACLTHPYGERMKPLLGEMRNVVHDSIVKLNGESLQDSEPSYRVKEIILNDVPVEKWAEVYTLNNAQRLQVSDQYGGIAGLLMTRKRVRGVMPDGTIIKERSSFVLRADDGTPLTQQDIDAMRAVPHGPNWQDEIVRAARLDEMVNILLDMDEHTIAIPIASTIYAYNEQLATLTARRHGDAEGAHYTVGRAAIVMGMDISEEREIREYGNMVLFGYKNDVTTDQLEVDE